MTADQLLLWDGTIPPDDPIKIITLRQPWANCSIFGVPGPGGELDYKLIENRTWQTSWRGRLFIHAGMDTDQAPSWAQPAGAGADGELPHGVILGYVTLVTCTRYKGWLPSRWADPEGWHWWLRDPVAFPEPVKASGRLGMWAPRLQRSDGQPDPAGIALAKAIRSAVTDAAGPDQR